MLSSFLSIDRFAPLGGSLPARDICNSGRATAPPIRGVRILPLSISLMKPSRKRPARTARSRRRGDSWTRRAATACAWTPEAMAFVFHVIDLPKIRPVQPPIPDDVDDEITMRSVGIYNPAVSPRWKKQFKNAREPLISLAQLPSTIFSLWNGSKDDSLFRWNYRSVLFSGRVGRNTMAARSECRRGVRAALFFNERERERSLTLCNRRLDFKIATIHRNSALKNDFFSPRSKRDIFFFTK